MKTCVTIYQGSEEATIEGPEFVDVLCNINKVAVDGEKYSDVSQVTIFDGDDE